MWSLYDNGKFLEPLVFSNGKSQEDVVKEVITAIRQGYKIIFIKGMCGTGKSAIALNIAKELGRAPIVVPIKTLQKQYEDDYSKRKYLIKKGKKLKIQVLTGRNNHSCPFIENIKMQETDSKQTKLFDDVSDKRKSKDVDKSCDNPLLPCKIEINEKNIPIIRNFIRLNPSLRLDDFQTVHDVKRMSIAPVCPYWSPILPAEFEINLPESKPITYEGMNKTRYAFYRRKPGCGYYDQFHAYIDADVIVFNSQKYELETAMNRKPATDVEIIDECDEFLDSLSNQRSINLNKLIIAISNLFFSDYGTMKLADEIIAILNRLIKSPEIHRLIESKAIIKIDESPMLKILRYFLDNPKLIETFEEDELNYCNSCYETAKIFENFLDETYISFNKEEKKQLNGKKEEEVIVKLVTINLEKRLKEFLDKNKVLVFMSGTLHSPEVLKKIFGITDFKIIEAESKSQGGVSKIRTGLERNFRYNHFNKGRLTRKQYLYALSACIEKAKKPVLVHVNSFSDLPSENERNDYKLYNLMTSKELKQLQKKYKMAELVDKFKEGKTQILFSTKCKRGMDFPGSTCNTIILTKYPYPDTSALFWQVLNKIHPTLFWTFYKDKARREFLQKIYRGLRTKDDHIYLLSPDIRVLNETIQ
jgi:Rad3-related DNA helicase